MMPRNFLRKSSLRIGTVLLALSMTDMAQALENQQMHRAMDRFMAGYVAKLKTRLGSQTRVEYSATALDNRQALADCSAPLIVEMREPAQPSARITLQITCKPDGNWSIYLPVDITIYRPVVVAVKPLTRGDTVGNDDVQLSDTNVTQINGQYLSSLDDAIGKDVKRAVTVGAPVLEQQLEAPLVVRRGEAIMISAASNIVAVKVSGVALTDGRLGEQIRIKNLSSNRIVQAKIVGSGQAEVPM